MQLRAEGRLIYHDQTGGPGDQLVALCQDPAEAEAVAKAVNDVDKIEPDLSELATAAGIDYARGWSAHDLLTEVTRQVRMVRRTMATGQFEHHAAR